mgnify:CR=1 FL=1
MASLKKVFLNTNPTKDEIKNIFPLKPNLIKDFSRESKYLIIKGLTKLLATVVENLSYSLTSGQI